VEEAGEGARRGEVCGGCAGGSATAGDMLEIVVPRGRESMKVRRRVGRAYKTQTIAPFAGVTLLLVLPLVSWLPLVTVEDMITVLIRRCLCQIMRRRSSSRSF